jgi:hypothetical protein
MINKYDLFVINDYSRFTWMFLLYDKNKAQDVLNKFLYKN